MQHTTRQAALHMIQTTAVFTVATIDASGFPTTVALSPLPLDRNLEQLFFYTSRQTTTVKNIQRCNRATLFCYHLADYASLMLKGHLTLVGHEEFTTDWRKELSPFQRRLNYHDPVILKFQTSSIKIREMMAMDHLELLPESSE
ncbi:pyridoxamine 5'-phosphate oxidase family protein [Lactiplantibacillus sp. WILCCON 0030]|uniref:Pyridoxamine 5'-phosphate oxidase family protein n=1 Tax=Lactiplantibacillus brownii TaxID=3069269 RepID=A0ABU1A4X3_9LACO|nr:pyridoxamine 5'-phosphate oxidase family protein [Lactiplantibacillus brownii]MDQ7936056.1 pyridoxamine 5'-phosphate oxidase family protein [Lactiplantibacillus brownii]